MRRDTIGIESAGWSPESRLVTVAIVSVHPHGAVDDVGADFLAARCEELGHRVIKRLSLPPDLGTLEAQLRAWVGEELVDVILVVGGVGLSPNDVAPEAVRAVLDREIPGYGEAVRAVRSERLGIRSIHGREIGGTSGHTFIFCISSEPESCQETWNQVIEPLLSRDSEASLVPLLAQLDMVE
ncbi:MAG: molybdopterin-binding protein [Sandaracinaceae bacterium]|nr:molybdopterin-binding protein [Sandaracinaceae bacterium]MDW8246177.1 molybdopterin-binding protein [Sandaracinaceae bacterium]